MYELLGICLSLAGLLVINSLASLLVAIFWRVISPLATSWSTSTRAQILFLLRIAPGLGAIMFVGVVFIPSYLANEPRHTTETVTAKLGLLAALSLYGIALASWRGFTTCLATRRLVRDWLKHAEPIQLENVSIPTFRVQHQFPVIAILGAIRPRLFIADQVFHSLAEEEISAAVAHENGHLVVGDNLKRGLLRACRNLLPIVSWGRSLEHAWVRTAESAADEYAASGGASVALDLASALVKVARLVPRGSMPATFAGASLITEDLGGIRARVLRLAQLATESKCPQRVDTHVLNLAVGACLSGLFMAVILTVYSSDRLAAIHTALESIVAALQ
jgi:Zn-dependent protease with chaperone function